MNDNYDSKQKIQVIMGFEHGLSADEIKSYANENHDWKEMLNLRIKIEKQKEEKNFNFKDHINKYKEQAERENAKLKDKKEIIKGDIELS